MARNGSGTYVLPAGNPVVTGSTISSTWANNTLNDIATALTGSIAKDGQTTPTANLPMGGYAHTNVADATVRAMYATAGQVQDGSFTLLSTVSGTDAITATANLGMASYVAGQRFSFVATGNNTGACTININSIGAKAITRDGTTALVAGDILSGAIYQIIYDGTQFQLLNPSPSTTVTSFSAGTTGLTPNTSTTGSVTLAGTLSVSNGGTGLTSLTANNVLLGNGASSIQVVSPGTSGNSLVSNGTTWVSGKQTITSGTAVNASGTSIDFTSIPSWVKRITIMFNGISTNGTSTIQIQIGSGSVTTSGYSCRTSFVGSGSSTASITSGFGLSSGGNAPASIYSGTMVLFNLSGNVWVDSSSVADTAGSGGMHIGGGNITLGNTLDIVRITTANGTDSFDAGSINILYE